MTKKVLSFLLLLMGMAQGAMAQEKEPYAVLSNDNKVLTFYYDTQKEERNGWSVDSHWWYFDAITNVAFDASFAECTSLTNTASWFYRCYQLTTIAGIENLKTDNVTDMSYMFCECSNLTSLDLSGFKTDNVTDMSYMFSGCSSLTSLDVTGFNTDNVTDLSWMFSGCSNLTSLDVSSFDTGNVTDMSNMFGGCSGLTNLDVSSFDTKKVMNMGGIFADCSSLTNLDVSSFNTWNVTDMSGIFSGCSKLTSLDVSSFDTWNVTDMSYMFCGCSSLTSLDVSSFDTGKVTDMNNMFFLCSNLTSLDLSNFNTWNVTDMSWMFCRCFKLTSLDVSSFDTGEVTDMSRMFYICSNLRSLDVSGFNTDNVTNMSWMFHYCISLRSLDVSSFDTGNVTDMGGMFSYCGLRSLDVSSFDTGNVTNMSQMFENCSGLTSIYCNDTWSCSYNSDMFYGCSQLPGYSGYDIAYAKPIADGGYFISKTEKANQVGTAYWWTYYTSVRNIKADENTTVYTATLNAEGTEIELTEVEDKTVPRGQAVILKSTMGEPLLYTISGEYAGTFPANDLRGTEREINKTEVGGTVYTLAAEGGNLAFYRYEGEKLAARKVFLVIEGSGARSIRIAGMEETGISDLAQLATEGIAYDLQGRRVSEPQKGLYIANGKKIVKR